MLTISAPTPDAATHLASNQISRSRSKSPARRNPLKRPKPPRDQEKKPPQALQKPRRGPERAGAARRAGKGPETRNGEKERPIHESISKLNRPENNK